MGGGGETYVPKNVKEKKKKVAMCLKPQVRELVLKERQLIFKIQKVKAVLQYWFLHN